MAAESLYHHIDNLELHVRAQSTAAVACGRVLTGVGAGGLAGGGSEGADARFGALPGIHDLEGDPRGRGVFDTRGSVLDRGLYA